MLDSFEILTTSGVVLWSKTYVPVGVNVISSLIKDVFIEEKAFTPPYKKDKYTLKFTTAKDLGLIFVAVYQSILHLSWIDQLLDNVKTLFTSLYRNEFNKPLSSVVKCPFDDYFDRQVHDLEKKAGATITSPAESTPTSDLTPPSSSGGDNGFDEDEPPPAPGFLKAQPQPESSNTSADVTPIPTPDSSRPSTPNSHLITAKKGPGSRSARRAMKTAPTSAPTSRDLSATKTKAAGKAPAKQKRTWNGDGMPDDGDDQVLDYSTASGPTSDGELDQTNGGHVPEAIEQSSWAKRTGQGEVVLKDLDEEMASILSSASAKSPADSQDSSTGLVGSGLGAISGLFRNVVGGKQLTQADLAKPLKGMEEHLVKKNVAQEATVRLCDAVSRDLIGTKTSSFQSIDNKLRASMESALTKILTPTSSLDLLRSIATHTSSSHSPNGPKRPYVISVVGVNGVGKSTTLAKLAFLLLNNNYRVLVAGADTFRSGAVEQLRVHVRNLQSLINTTSSASNPLGHIDLYERGYGKDPAHIARDAVAYAAAPPPLSSPSSPSGQQQQQPFDVVLIDTAGRRHNDTRLMASLEGFARLAVPDKIFMVGEALVGSDSVAQARHFNAAFGPGRRLDGFIVSKCDTVGEMVGTVVSMVHATGVPVVAVGVGQHYGDLRGLNVGWCTRLLMQ